MGENGSSNFSFFIAGLGIGAIVALLLAPGAGSETRDLIAKKADKGKDFARQKSKELRKDAESYLGKGREAVEKQKEQLSAAFEAGKSVYQNEKTKGQ